MGVRHTDVYHLLSFVVGRPDPRGQEWGDVLSTPLIMSDTIVLLAVIHQLLFSPLCSLQHAQCDSAKCRGWIRMAVNDCTFASYLNVLCQDHTLLNWHYEPYSFVRDHEMVSMVTDLLDGLTHIPFKL